MKTKRTLDPVQPKRVLDPILMDEMIKVLEEDLKKEVEPPANHALEAVVSGIESLLNQSQLYKQNETLFYALHYWVSYGKKCLGKDS